MKRFLVIFTLISFATVSCAGPTNLGKLKTLEKDWKDCSESTDKNRNSGAFGKVFEECLEKKGYKYMNSKDIVSRDEFEKDRKECIESTDKNLSSEAFGKGLEECFAKKGYEFKRTSPVLNTVLLSIVMAPVGAAFLLLQVGGRGGLGFRP